jgi:hypothetical protein
MVTVRFAGTMIPAAGGSVKLKAVISFFYMLSPRLLYGIFSLKSKCRYLGHWRAIGNAERGDPEAPRKNLTEKQCDCKGQPKQIYFKGKE